MTANTLNPGLVELSADELLCIEGGLFPVAAAVVGAWAGKAFLAGVTLGVTAAIAFLD